MQIHLASATTTAARLARKYGEVLLSADLADILQISSNALRLALTRGGDVPRPSLLPGKGHRWLVADVAAWLDSHSTADVPTAAVAEPDPVAPAIRRPGRPRTRQSAAGDAQ